MIGQGEFKFARGAAHLQTRLRAQEFFSQARLADAGRENYIAAAQLLKEVRALYLELDESHKWQVEIAALRERHRTLPALKDELNNAGL